MNFKLENRDKSQIAIWYVLFFIVISYLFYVATIFYQRGSFSLDFNFFKIVLIDLLNSFISAYLTLVFLNTSNTEEVSEDVIDSVSNGVNYFSISIRIILIYTLLHAITSTNLYYFVFANKGIVSMDYGATFFLRLMESYKGGGLLAGVTIVYVLQKRK